MIGNLPVVHQATPYFTSPSESHALHVVLSCDNDRVFEVVFRDPALVRRLAWELQENSQ